MNIREEGILSPKGLNRTMRTQNQTPLASRLRPPVICQMSQIQTILQKKGLQQTNCELF